MKYLSGDVIRHAQLTPHTGQYRKEKFVISVTANFFHRPFPADFAPFDWQDFFQQIRPAAGTQLDVRMYISTKIFQ